MNINWQIGVTNVIYLKILLCQNRSVVTTLNVDLGKKGKKKHHNTMLEITTFNHDSPSSKPASQPFI